MLVAGQYQDSGSADLLCLDGRSYFVPIETILVLYSSFYKCSKLDVQGWGKVHKNSGPKWAWVQQVVQEYVTNEGW